MRKDKVEAVVVKACKLCEISCDQFALESVFNDASQLLSQQI